MNNTDFAAGASASLKKTMGEVMALPGQHGPQPTNNLRDSLYERLADLAVSRFPGSGWSESRRSSALAGRGLEDSLGPLRAATLIAGRARRKARANNKAD